jgi:hypothetical protein
MRVGGDIMISQNYYELVNQLLDINYQVSTTTPKITSEKEQMISSIINQQKKIEEDANEQIRGLRLKQKEKIKKIHDDKSYLLYEVEVEFNGLRTFIVEYRGRLEQALMDHRIQNNPIGKEKNDNQEISINFEDIKDKKLRIITLFEKINSNQ